MRETFCSKNHSRIHLWRWNNTRYDHDHIFEEALSGHVTYNMWGWMSVHGVGDITQIEGRCNAKKYVDVFENFFLPSLHRRSFPFPPGPIFVQDRCPVHTAAAVQLWFSGH